MDEKNNKRIGIFEYDSSLYGFIKDFAIAFAEAGYLVDIFYKDWELRHDFTKTSEFEHYEGIRFFNFTTKTTRGEILRRRLKRLLNRIAIFLSIKLNDKPERVIDPNLLEKAKETISGSQYLCFIGIEKKGLIWAGMFSEIYKRPLFYYNLELYIEDNPDIDKVYHLRDAEKRYHQLSTGTIIQDRLRASALLKNNEIERTNILYFPVSVKGNIIEERSKYLQSKFNIGQDKKIILYFGSIHETRCVAQIVKMAGDLDQDVILVVHGWGPKKYLDYLQSIADKNKVVFSLGFLAEDEIVSMVSSAHIGIALYVTSNLNDRWVAFSSSKMAYYTQCGVPIIALDTESWRMLMDVHKCGELIHSVNDIPDATRRILINYELYEREAHAAYEQFYNFENNFAKFRSQFEATLASNL